MNNPGLIELQAVVSVATHRSFRRAADELGLSPSALSHAVGSLEKRIGVRLFNRTTRSVTPSEAGEQFLSKITPALGQIRDAINGVNEFRDKPKGTIRLNASEAAAKMVMEPLIMEFLSRYPEMQVDLVTEGRMVDVIAEGFDAGIRQAEFVPLDMVAVRCSPPIRYVVVGTPAFFEKHGVPKHPHDLMHYTCIKNRLPAGQLFNWDFRQGDEVLSIEPQGPLVLDNYNLRIQASTQGLGLTWVNEWAVSEQLKTGRLVAVLQDWAVDMPPLSLYYPRQHHFPAGMRAFIDLAKEVFSRS